jgi:hypothetical protein
LGLPTSATMGLGIISILSGVRSVVSDERSRRIDFGFTIAVRWSSSPSGFRGRIETLFQSHGPSVAVGIGVGVPCMDNTTSSVPGRMDSTNTFPFKGCTSGLS